MQPTFLVPLVFALLAYTPIALSNQCDDFKNAVRVEPSVAKISAEAGKEVILPLKISIDAAQAAKWTSIDLSIGSANGIAGTTSMYSVYFLTNERHELNIPAEISLQSFANMGGSYTLNMAFYARSDDYPGICLKRWTVLPNFTVDIVNTPDNTDITPPVLKNIRFAKEVYGLNDTLEIIFEAEDKSLLCTAWNAQAGCGFGTHVELLSIGGLHVIAFHAPTPVFNIAENKFMALVPLSEKNVGQDLTPGLYRLTHLMVGDVHRNFFHLMPANSEVKVELKQQ